MYMYFSLIGHSDLYFLYHRDLHVMYMYLYKFSAQGNLGKDYKYKVYM